MSISEPVNKSQSEADVQTSSRSLSVGQLGLLVTAIFFLDQLSKYLSNAWLQYGEAITVIPGFDLLLVYNSGAAFSFLSNADGWQRWILSGVSLVVSICIMIYIPRVPLRHKLLRLSLAVILGGALGNLYDRIVLGYVVDFISLYFGQWRFATFNVADAAISVGAALLVLDTFLARPEDKRNG